MYFFAVLNKELPLGKSLNALAHMALGLGHRINNGMPGVKVYFDMKASMLVKKGLSLGSQINQTVRACLEVGKNAQLADLHLLSFMDADNIAHQHISYHPFPIITPASPAKHKAMAEKALKATNIDSRLSQYSAMDESNPILSVIFGQRSEVESIFTKKETSFYRQELIEEDLVKSAVEGMTIGLLRKSMQDVLSISVG